VTVEPGLAERGDAAFLSVGQQRRYGRHTGDPD